MSEIKNAKITLLTVEEAEKVPQEIRRRDQKWWLRTPGKNERYVTYVNFHGVISTDGHYVYYPEYGIRPALVSDEFAALNLKVGDKIKYLGMEWVAIADNMVLADKMLWSGKYDIQYNDYEKSRVKGELAKWQGTQIKEFGREVEVL